jgi:hypothetical protein
LRHLVKSRNTLAADQRSDIPITAGLADNVQSLGFLRKYGRFCACVEFSKGLLQTCPVIAMMSSMSASGSAGHHPASAYHDGTVITLDPVSTAPEGWNDFLVAYNEFCSKNGGSPLFNQTPFLTHAQVKKALGARLTNSSNISGASTNRFLTPHSAILGKT